MKKILAFLLLGCGFAAQAHADDMALVDLSVACMRSAPKYSAELVSQVVMGTPVKLLDKDGGWYKIESPEGYEGWVWRASLTPLTDAEMAEWRRAPRLIVTAHYQQQVYADPDTRSPRRVVRDLLPGNIVEGTMTDVRNGRVKVTFPDGVSGWVDAGAMTPVEVWAAQDFDADVILDQAYALEGNPYLWGGASAKATDCSGLVKVSYYANGYILKRDASQQARTGQRLEADDWRDYQPGDLMFFSGSPEGTRVTHVAIYDHDGWFVHCAGKVKRNNIDPASEGYDGGHYMLSGTRIHGSEGTDGIVQVRNHPWFFEND